MKTNFSLLRIYQITFHHKLCWIITYIEKETSVTLGNENLGCGGFITFDLPADERLFITSLNFVSFFTVQLMSWHFLLLH